MPLDGAVRPLAWVPATRFDSVSSVTKLNARNRRKAITRVCSDGLSRRAPPNGLRATLHYQPGENMIGYTTVTIPPSGCGKLKP